MRFLRFSYYKTANRTTPCGVVRCSALLFAVRCSYAILRVVLVQFLRFVQFMRFGEHPYHTAYTNIKNHELNTHIYTLTISKHYDDLSNTNYFVSKLHISLSQCFLLKSTSLYRYLKLGSWWGLIMYPKIYNSPEKCWISKSMRWGP